ncbi:MAG: hypothetical protein Q4B79_07465 [Moraxella sp.]|uniref:hypothetical protein n=1 Tax=Moraxella sp. TaxID=479 RepID=UPI0026DD5C24|nr:hypothetical protein [Moraxella sp.]MDO4450776.1 hypothetical protein [Moraxella sp.]
MPIELSTLPPVVVEQKMNLKNDKAVQPSYAKGDFDYDLERMKKAVEAPYVVMPKFDNDDDFFAWVENLTDDDFISEKV